MRTHKKNSLEENSIVARSSGDFFEQKNGVLRLADGYSINGLIPKWFEGAAVGEVVFNTGMTGYVETLTDPSYAEQIVVFTYPLIGNYGVHKDKWQSGKIHARGVVLANLIDDWSHPKSYESFGQWLKGQNVPVFSQVDTRQLTQYLRSKGTMSGTLQPKAAKPENLKPKIPLVTINQPVSYNETGKQKVILVDCGAKENIVRSLVSRNLSVRRVPYDYDFTSEDYDGVVLSNGPGNPNEYQPTIKVVAKCLKANKPVFGICLGNQIMALAAGGKTYKLKFGHRGHNQPCMEEANQRCIITSQNHGYSVDRKSLPKDWKVLFKNLNDDSIEGIYHNHKPFFSVQFHPEATPGPTDSEYLFDRFVNLL